MLSLRSLAFDALVLGGAQGIGKDTLLEPVKYVVTPDKPDHGSTTLLGFLAAALSTLSIGLRTWSSGRPWGPNGRKKEKRRLRGREVNNSRPPRQNFLAPLTTGLPVIPRAIRAAFVD
jgi:hypothetical protein